MQTTQWNQDSYKEHHAQYLGRDTGGFKEKIEEERRLQAADGEFRLYEQGHRQGEMLDKYPDIKVAVDIGSGAGWMGNYLVETRNYELVHAIEPSSAAQKIARELYPDLGEKVNYINGFAEEEIAKLEFDQPVFFNSFCVLSHIQDQEVSGILNAINEVAPKGSVFASRENWGPEFHDDASIWHVRTIEWWKSHLPDWTWSFEKTDPLGWPAHPDRFIGFCAVKE